MNSSIPSQPAPLAAQIRAVRETVVRGDASSGAAELARIRRADVRLEHARELSLLAVVLALRARDVPEARRLLQVVGTIAPMERTILAKWLAATPELKAEESWVMLDQLVPSAVPAPTPEPEPVSLITRVGVPGLIAAVAALMLLSALVGGAGGWALAGLLHREDGAAREARALVQPAPAAPSPSADAPGSAGAEAPLLSLAPDERSLVNALMADSDAVRDWLLVVQRVGSVAEAQQRPKSVAASPAAQSLWIRQLDDQLAQAERLASSPRLARLTEVDAIGRLQRLLPPNQLPTGPDSWPRRIVGAVERLREVGGDDYGLARRQELIVSVMKLCIALDVALARPGTSPDPGLFESQPGVQSLLRRFEATRMASPAWTRPAANFVLRSEALAGVAPNAASPEGSVALFDALIDRILTLPDGTRAILPPDTQLVVSALQAHLARNQRGLTTMMELVASGPVGGIPVATAAEPSQAPAPPAVPDAEDATPQVPVTIAPPEPAAPAAAQPAAIGPRKPSSPEPSRPVAAEPLAPADPQPEAPVPSVPSRVRPSEPAKAAPGGRAVPAQPTAAPPAERLPIELETVRAVDERIGDTAKLFRWLAQSHRVARIESILAKSGSGARAMPEQTRAEIDRLEAAIEGAAKPMRETAKQLEERAARLRMCKPIPGRDSFRNALEAELAGLRPAPASPDRLSQRSHALASAMQFCLVLDAARARAEIKLKAGDQQAPIRPSTKDYLWSYSLCIDGVHGWTASGAEGLLSANRWSSIAPRDGEERFGGTLELFDAMVDCITTTPSGARYELTADAAKVVDSVRARLKGNQLILDEVRR